MRDKIQRRRAALLRILDTANGPPVEHDRARKLRVPLYEATGDHVMQRLLLFSDARHDAIDQEVQSADGRHVTYSTARKKPPARFTKR